MKALNDRRSGTDRRKSKQPASFPLQDCNGELVIKDRRISPDRRVEGLELTVSDMPNEEFYQFFKKFQENLSS